MKECMINLTPRFDARRMVHQYTEELYDPADRNWRQMAACNFEEARERANWSARVREIWPQVNFVDMGPAPSGPVTSGKAVCVRTKIRLAGLKPKDVRVECVIGRIGASGGLEETEVVVLQNNGAEGDVAVYEKDIVPAQTGRLGYAVRVTPNHYDDPLTRPVTSLLKWSGR
jgi:starch phosphorylase